MAKVEEQYIPGVCNIGAYEVGSRVRFAIIGIMLFFVYALIIYYFSLDKNWRIPLFIPAFMAAIGFLQARNRFCVRNAFLARSVIAGKTHHQNKYVEKDRRRALKLVFYAAIIAAFVTAVVYNFPL